tara:strand:- start:3 stop:542 length:540 start_codon:yes stop_codon:yes gene_type:complete
MAVKRLKDLPKDLDKKISRDFNRLIKNIHNELSNEENMPVWTGFFASSWKASNTPVTANHKVEDYQPWASIKRERSLDFFARRKAGPPFTKQTPPENPVIQPRFPVGTGNRIFNYRKAVWIGNKAIYSQYVLETGEIQEFVQNQLGRLIKENMSDKGKLFIGGGVSEKFSGTTYTGFEA